MEENKDAITKLDITLHEKSQDMTGVKLKLDYSLYEADEQSQHDINPDFNKSDLMDVSHGKSYDFIDAK